jgi:predicted transcriptional regulator
MPKSRRKAPSSAHKGAIIEAIERGWADLRTGKLVPHNEAMAELDTLIDNIEAAIQQA